MSDNFYRRLDEAMIRSRNARIFANRPENLHDYQGCVKDQESPLPFDLEKALSGAPLVTRDGRRATFFKRSSRTDSTYLFEALIDGKSYCFTSWGAYWVTRPDALDLFLTGECE